MVPTDPTILGFGASEWFGRGFERAATYELPNGARIQAFDALHLLAAKIEAYCDRGHGDWLVSRDVEDIASILDGRSTIFDELAERGDVQDFVRRWFRSFPDDELAIIIGTHVADYARGELLVGRLAATRSRTAP